MASCHRFAKRAISVLQYLAMEWGVNIGADSGSCSLQDFERYVQPQARSMNFFAPNVQMDGYLFCPFPMQGRPFVSDTDGLERAGFEVL